jgi:hypothetical protein
MWRRKLPRSRHKSDAWALSSKRSTNEKGSRSIGRESLPISESGRIHFIVAGRRGDSECNPSAPAAKSANWRDSAVSGYFDERNSIYLLYSGIGDQPGRSIVRRFGRIGLQRIFPSILRTIFTINDSKRDCVVADSDWRFDRLRNLPPIRLPPLLRFRRVSPLLMLRSAEPELKRSRSLVIRYCLQPTR